MNKRTGNNNPYEQGAPQPRPDFSMKKFIKSPDFIATALMLVIGFVLLFAAYKFVEKEIVKLVLMFLGVSMTFSSTDQMIEIFNEKRYGIKSAKRKNLFDSNKPNQNKE